MNIAAQLQTTASPNDILVSDAVRERLRDSPVFEDRGIIALKGDGQIGTHILCGRMAS